MPNDDYLRSSIKWENVGFDPQTTAGLRILVVDDNEALRYSVARSLRDAGYRVTEACNGADALRRAEEAPDLITLDVNLPDMHGFDICRQIKTNPTTSHIPILHLSSTFVDPEARVQGLASGADAYLAEPIDRAELIATVGALLRLKTAEAAARQQAEIAEAARREAAELNATLEKRVSERTADLKAANNSLRDLSVRLLQIQDDERRRIARELHDSVGQLLAAIAMNNGIIQGEGDKLSPSSVRALAENEQHVEEILRSIRTISHLLHPPLLDEVGLPSALRWYVTEFGQRSGIEVDLDCDPDFGRLPGEMETAIFRIVQESLSNVHRHSASPNATIRLRIIEGKAHLQISDAGRGITAEKQRGLTSRGGVGLRGMRERVAQFGGELQIKSDNKGTTVQAVLPLGSGALAAERGA